MKKIYASLIIFIFILLVSITVVGKTYSDNSIDQLTQQISDLTKSLTMSQNATRPLEGQLQSMQAQVAAIKNRISGIEYDVAMKKKNIAKQYADLAKQQTVLNATISDYYIRSYYASPMFSILSSTANQTTQVLAYQKAATDQDKAIITNLALSITDLQIKQKNLEGEEQQLAIAKTNLDEQSAKLDKIIVGAKAYQASLTSQIAQLSAQQQALIAAKQASLGLPTSAYTTKGGCVDDRNTDPGFSPRFALFTYGVPNRVGLNQYGAKGRADAGQSAEQILSAYYNADLNKSYNTDNINITLQGNNDYGENFDSGTYHQMNIEEYLKHLYEMPSSWSSEALKAQAVAARSYALAASNNGQTPIGTDQHYQEVKTELNAQSWIDAVTATKGWVLTNGGTPIKAWFSSTHGGYVHSSGDIGWSGTSWTKNALDASGPVNSFSDLQNNAYDKNSPWFYCDWGARSSYSNTAWLKSDEMADIINVMMLGKADPSTQTHLSQTDKPNPDGTDTWDSGRVKQELKNRGINPYNSIDSISVSADFGSGKTTSVNVSGDGGNKNFDATDFKNFFNLRAPANINIVGPLYNVEKR